MSTWRLLQKNQGGPEGRLGIFKSRRDAYLRRRQRPL